MARSTLARLAPSLALFAALLVAWQAAGPLFGIREYLLPGPVAVARAALNFSIPWPTHLWITTLEIVGGFALARAARVLLRLAVGGAPAGAGALPGVRQHAAQGGGGAAVPALARLRHRAQHPHRRADRLLPRGHQHRRGAHADRRGAARPRPRVLRNHLEGA